VHLKAIVQSFTITGAVGIYLLGSVVRGISISDVLVLAEFHQGVIAISRAGGFG